MMYIREILKYFTMKKFYLKFILFLAVSLCSKSNLIAQTQTVVIGTSSLISAFSPIVKSYECVAYESIYLSTEIGYSGAISTFGFNRVDGTDTLPFDSVSIFMKQTALTSLTAGVIDTTGYTRVYDGSFPNSAGAGWREVSLNLPFAYNNSSNLSVLVFKHTQAATAGTPVTPRWYYTSVSPNRARRYYGTSPMAWGPNLSVTNVLSDIRMTIGTVGIVDISAGLCSVYPNPTDGLVNIVVHNEKVASMLVSDISGKIVADVAALKQLTVDLRNLSNGIYTIQFFDNTKQLMAAKKIAIKK